MGCPSESETSGEEEEQILHVVSDDQVDSSEQLQVEVPSLMTLLLNDVSTDT